MKTIISAALISLAAGSAAFASVQPIPGSITYDNANVSWKRHLPVRPSSTPSPTVTAVTYAKSTRLRRQVGDPRQPRRFERFVINCASQDAKTSGGRLGPLSPPHRAAATPHPERIRP